MRHLSIVFVFVVLAAMSCNSNNQTKGTGAKTAIELPAQSRLSDTGTQKIVVLINSYYELKDALIAAKAVNADVAAHKLADDATNMMDFLQTDSANRSILNPYLDTISTQSALIVGTMDETCEKKRIYFGKLSDVLYELLRKMALKNAGVYRDYCPMAFNEKGAYWLSNETEIKNPYFGKKMIECGEVTDSLK